MNDVRPVLLQVVVEQFLALGMQRLRSIEATQTDAAEALFYRGFKAHARAWLQQLHFFKRAVFRIQPLEGQDLTLDLRLINSGLLEIGNDIVNEGFRQL